LLSFTKWLPAKLQPLITSSSASEFHWQSVLSDNHGCSLNFYVTIESPYDSHLKENEICAYMHAVTKMADWKKYCRWYWWIWQNQPNYGNFVKRQIWGHFAKPADQLNGWIHITYLEEPQTVDECGKNDEFGGSSECDKIFARFVDKVLHQVNTHNRLRRAPKTWWMWRKQ